MRNEDRFSLKLVLEIVFRDEKKIKWWKNTRLTCKIWKEVVDSSFPFEDSKILANSVKSGDFCFFSHILDRSKPCLNDNFALTEALNGRKYEWIELLLEKGRGEADCFNNILIRRAVNFCNISLIKRLLKDPKTDPSITICSAVRNWICGIGSFEVIKLLLEDDRVEHFDAIEWIIANAPKKAKKLEKLLNFDGLSPSAKARAVLISFEYPKITNTLLRDNRIDPSANDNIIICQPRLNHLAMELLLKDSRVDPSARDNILIRQISQNGHPSECLKLLLSDPRVDPSANDYEALRGLITSSGWNLIGGAKQKLESIKLLLAHPKVDPSFDHNLLLRMAVKDRLYSYDLCLLILKDPRVNPGDCQSEAFINLVGEYFQRKDKTRLKLAKTLINDPRVDPSARESISLVKASLMEPWWSVIELLMNDKRMDPSAQDYAILTNISGRRDLKYSIFKMIWEDPRVNLSIQKKCEIVSNLLSQKQRDSMRAAQLVLREQEVFDSLNPVLKKECSHLLQAK